MKLLFSVEMKSLKVMSTLSLILRLMLLDFLHKVVLVWMYCGYIAHLYKGSRD